MAKIGYARVSTQDQKLDLQIDALKQHGVERIFQEKLSGIRAHRTEFEAMKGYLREGDTVVVWKLDRIGRSMKDLIATISEFQSRGIAFVSLKENIDTSTATGNLIFNIFASLAEFERDIISERTRAGLASARQRGRMNGRPKISKEKIETAIKMYHSQNYSVQEILQMAGISHSTFYRYLKQKER